MWQELLTLVRSKAKRFYTIVHQFCNIGSYSFGALVDNIASFSTAVTQGGVEMVIDALKTAGNGTWFRVFEQNGIDALIRERQIIRSARQDYAKATDTDPQGLQPLLFAGMIIEGGIIG